MSLESKLEAKLNEYFAAEAGLVGEPNIRVTLEKGVKGYEKGSLVHRDTVKVLMPADFLAANESENAALAGSIHTKAAEFLNGMGYNPKAYRPVLSSRVVDLKTGESVPTYTVAAVVPTEKRQLH